MTYKAKDRYTFGWNDPRAVDLAERFEEIRLIFVDHFARDMTNDQLKAAWILAYGDRPISFYELKRRWAQDETGDDMRVAQETHFRGLLLSQYDFASITDIYVLKDKLNASN
jgi:hypothetical protein